MSWQPLCESNPIPGNPDGVAVLSRDLASVACELREQTLTLQRISSDDFWEGDAANEFREHQTKLPPYLEQLATRYEKVSDALGQYHPELHEAQQEAFRALQKAQQAEQDIRAAELRVQQKAQWEENERCRVEAWNSQNPKEAPLSPHPWPDRDPAADLCVAQDALADARRELECAIERYEDAARKCAREIESAIDDDLKNESGLLPWLKRAAAWMVDNLPIKGLAQVLEILAVVIAVIALVALVIVTGGTALAVILWAGFIVAATKLVADIVLWGADEKSGRDVMWSLVDVATAAFGLAAFKVLTAERVGRFVLSARAEKWLRRVDDGVSVVSNVGTIGRFLWDRRHLLDPEPETRPRCDFVPRPCVYRPPVCPNPSTPELRVEHGPVPPPLEVAPGPVPPNVAVQSAPAPRDVAVLHRVQPGGVFAASPQPAASVVLQGS